MRGAVRLVAIVAVSLTALGCSSYDDNGDGNVQTDSRGGGYWYCWDNGGGGAHHIGHPVAGDHPC